MAEPEPVGYDGHGAPIYGWQIADRLSPEDRQKLLDSVDNDRV